MEKTLLRDPGENPARGQILVVIRREFSSRQEKILDRNSRQEVAQFRRNANPGEGALNFDSKIWPWSKYRHI